MGSVKDLEKEIFTRGVTTGTIGGEKYKCKGERDCKPGWLPNILESPRRGE